MWFRKQEFASAALGTWHLAGFYLACNVLSNSNAWLYVFSLCAKFILINGLYSV